MRRYLMISIVFMLLGSCALIPSESQTPTAGSIKVQKTAESKEGTSMPETAVITFQRSGGLAGKTLVWTIFTDGHVVSEQGSVQMSSGDVSQLVTDLTSQGIFDLKDSYGGLSTCNDCFTYTITVTVNNQTKTITTMDGATDTPAELVKILSLINNFINKIPQQ